MQSNAAGWKRIGFAIADRDTVSHQWLSDEGCLKGTEGFLKAESPDTPGAVESSARGSGV